MKKDRERERQRGKNDTGKAERVTVIESTERM